MTEEQIAKQGSQQKEGIEMLKQLDSTCSKLILGEIEQIQWENELSVLRSREYLINQLQNVTLIAFSKIRAQTFSKNQHLDSTTNSETLPNDNNVFNKNHQSMSSYAMEEKRRILEFYNKHYDPVKMNKYELISQMVKESGYSKSSIYYLVTNQKMEEAVQMQLQKLARGSSFPQSYQYSLNNISTTYDSTTIPQNNQYTPNESDNSNINSSNTKSSEKIEDNCNQKDSASPQLNTLDLQKESPAALVIVS